MTSAPARPATRTLFDLSRAGLFTDGDWVESKDQDPSGEVRLTQLADVGVTEWRDRSDRWLREDQAARLGCTFLRPGDILIARMPDPIGRACLVPEGIGRAVTVVDVAILRLARADVDRRFIMWAINTPFVNDQIVVMQAGATRERISRKNLGSVRVPFPPVHVQERVADYLDAETARIDALISKQEQLIKLMRERRVLARESFAKAVLTGKRLKWRVRETDIRAGDQASRFPLLSVSIDWGVRRRDEVTGDLPRAEDLSNYKLCRSGEIVINRMRAFQGALGVVPEDGIVSPDYAVLRTRDGVGPEWLAEVMRTRCFVSEMVARLRGIGGTDAGNVRTPRINVADLLDIRVDVPTEADQRAAVRQYRDTQSRLDALIAKANQFIALARERRSALITAAVTGQIDVTKSRKTA